MTRAEAARRYLTASMSAHTTALPGEAREAHERTMADLERKHPGAAELAVVGVNADFDRNLEKGEKEHQRFLRGGLSEKELRSRREKARGSSSPSSPSSRSPRRPSPASRRTAVRAGVRGGRAYARAHRTILQSSGAGDAGSIVLQAIGVGIGLSLLYLALSPNGSSAFSKLLAAASKAIGLLIAPVDPLNPHAASSHKGAGQIGPANAAPAGAVTASPVQRAKLNPRFGPAPGIGTPITPTGVFP